jgi:hypothetical protein
MVLLLSDTCQAGFVLDLLLEGHCTVEIIMWCWYVIQLLKNNFDIGK